MPRVSWTRMRANPTRGETTAMAKKALPARKKILQRLWSAGGSGRGTGVYSQKKNTQPAPSKRHPLRVPNYNSSTDYLAYLFCIEIRFNVFFCTYYHTFTWERNLIVCMISITLKAVALIFINCPSVENSADSGLVSISILTAPFKAM